LYDGKVIRAFFHANAGGYTESSENVWQTALPYLKAVPSPDDQYAVRYPVQSNGWPASSYYWTKKMTREELETCLANWNQRQVQNGRNDGIIDIGQLIDIAISRLDRNGTGETRSGRVTELTFIGTKGKKSFYRDNIRSILGLKSTLFGIEFDSAVTILSAGGGRKEVHSAAGLVAVNGDKMVDLVNSGAEEYFIMGNGVKRKVPKNFQNITIAGKGHGHGLGLSQWGARGMAAERGATYKEIIKYYYKGIEIKKIY